MVLFAKAENREEGIDAVFSPWSIVHYFSGSVAWTWLDIDFWPWEAVHLAYELKDQVGTNANENSEIFTHNSLENSIGDTIATTAGHLTPFKKRSWIPLVGLGASLLWLLGNDELG